jgi:hypothetical protein
MASAFNQLMLRLGYPRYVSQGGRAMERAGPGANLTSDSQHSIRPEAPWLWVAAQ